MSCWASSTLIISRAYLVPTAICPLIATWSFNVFTNWQRRHPTQPAQPHASPQDLAEGFLRIAVDNMANAIKKISVQRGHDVTDYTLQCFGGAWADMLVWSRMRRAYGVFLHPFAGVLSAYGMGLAQIRAMREMQLDVQQYEPYQ